MMGRLSSIVAVVELVHMVQYTLRAAATASARQLAPSTRHDDFQVLRLHGNRLATRHVYNVPARLRVKRTDGTALPIEIGPRIEAEYLHALPRC